MAHSPRSPLQFIPILTSSTDGGPIFHALNSVSRIQRLSSRDLEASHFRPRLLGGCAKIERQVSAYDMKIRNGETITSHLCESGMRLRDANDKGAHRSKMAQESGHANGLTVGSPDPSSSHARPREAAARPGLKNISSVQCIIRRL